MKLIAKVNYALNSGLSAQFIIVLASNSQWSRKFTFIELVLFYFPINLIIV